MKYTLRIKKNKVFKYIFKKGEYAKGKYVVVHSCKTKMADEVEDSMNFFAVCVSKKNGNSVQRNRLKRIAREVYKQEEKFLKKLGIDYDRNDFRGAMLPFGEYVKNPINKNKNLLLVGDAAGLVDPITGEGIYFAILSGIKSSNIIMKALNENNKNEVDKYVEEISGIMRNIEKGAKLKKLIYKYKKPIFNAMKNKKVGNFLFNECLYDSNYDLLK